MGDGAIAIRPFVEADRPFLLAVVARLWPGETVGRRDEAAFQAANRRLAGGETALPEGAEWFVATDAGGERLGALILFPERDFGSGRPRAYVSVLAVAASAEGRGVARALLAHAEEWARARGYDEIALEHFSTNTHAAAVYEHLGYRVDTVKRIKRL